MKTLKHILCIGLLFSTLFLLMPGCVHAQQEPTYSLYMFNGLALNPAYAGSRNALSAVIIGRKQWTGMSAGPQTGSLGVHVPSTDQRHGIGLLCVADESGYVQNISFVPAYAYRIPVGLEGTLSLGIQGGLNSYSLRLSGVDTWQPDDPAFTGQDFKKVHAVVGTGVYFKTQRVYAGISVPNLLPNKLYGTDEFGREARRYVHTYASAGIVLDVGDGIKVKPSALLRYLPGMPLSLDLNLSALVAEKFWVGGTWRPRTGWGMMLEVNATDFLRVGYAYDLMNNGLSPYARGTHEIMLGIDLEFEKSNISSPRFF